MKRILMAVAMIFALSTANMSAQSTGIINRSDRSMIGGSVDLSSIGNFVNNDEYYTDLQLNCQPFISDFTSDNFAVGLTVNLNFVNRTFNNPNGWYEYDDAQYLTAIFLPHLRLYFVDNTFLSIDAGGGYMGSIGSGSNGYVVYGGNVGVGHDFPISNDVFLEAAIGYGIMKYESIEDDDDYGYYSDRDEKIIKVSVGVVATF